MTRRQVREIAQPKPCPPHPRFAWMRCLSHQGNAHAWEAGPRGRRIRFTWTGWRR